MFPLLSSDDAPADITTRFEKSAIAAASIQHPNVLGILQFGKTIDGSHFFLVTESIAGQTLQRLLRSEIWLPSERVLSLIIQIAVGLCTGHEEGLLHLDLRPEIIYVIQTRPQGKAAAGTELVKVGYFSLQAWTNDGNFDYGLTGTQPTPPQNKFLGLPRSTLERTCTRLVQLPTKCSVADLLLAVI